MFILIVFCFLLFQRLGPPPAAAAGAPAHHAPAAHAANRPVGQRMALARSGRTAQSITAEPLVSYITVFSLNFVCV